MKNLVQRLKRNGLVWLVALNFSCAPIAMLAADGHWVTTWGCGPQLTESGNLPPMPLANSTLRQFVHTTLGGKHVRLRLSNAYGTDSVTIRSAHLALAAGAGSATNLNHINTATDTTLTFRGAPAVVIPPGEVVLSDPIPFDLPAVTNVAISIYFGNISASTINGHPGSRTTSFIIGSNVVSSASMTGASTTKHWYIITGVDVLADSSSRAVVTLGDSITDGRGPADDINNRWPDFFASRLATNAPTAGVSVVNMGIGAASLLGEGGIVNGIPSGTNRFDRDVLNQSGARYVIVFIGVNDINGNQSATSLIAAYTQLANKAHARGILAYGATITPFGGNSYYSNAHETTRTNVNNWFRTNSIYDGVIDFDAAVRTVNLTNFQAAYYAGPYANDWLHLNAAGYQAMADAIDLILFTQ